MRCSHPNCSSHQQSMCGVPPPSFYVVRCPHPMCYSRQQSMCGVPPSQYTFFLCGVPPNVVFFSTVALSWILSKIENLASSSLQDKALLNLYPRVWHSQLTLLYIILHNIYYTFQISQIGQIVLLLEHLHLHTNEKMCICTTLITS